MYVRIVHQRINNQELQNPDGEGNVISSDNQRMLNIRYYDRLEGRSGGRLRRRWRDAMTAGLRKIGII